MDREIDTTQPDERLTTHDGRRKPHVHQHELCTTPLVRERVWCLLAPQFDGGG